MILSFMRAAGARELAREGASSVLEEEILHRRVGDAPKAVTFFVGCTCRGVPSFVNGGFWDSWVSTPIMVLVVGIRREDRCCQWASLMKLVASIVGGGPVAALEMRVRWLTSAAVDDTVRVGANGTLWRRNMHRL